MYAFKDTDSWSETFGKWCVRDGCISYDGFDSYEDAINFIINSEA